MNHFVFIVDYLNKFYTVKSIFFFNKYIYNKFGNMNYLYHLCCTCFSFYYRLSFFGHLIFSSCYIDSLASLLHLQSFMALHGKKSRRTIGSMANVDIEQHDSSRKKSQSQDDATDNAERGKKSHRTMGLMGDIDQFEPLRQKSQSQNHVSDNANSSDDDLDADSNTSNSLESSEGPNSHDIGDDTSEEGT